MEVEAVIEMRCLISVTIITITSWFNLINSTSMENLPGQLFVLQTSLSKQKLLALTVLPGRMLLALTKLLKRALQWVYLEKHH